MSYQNQANPVDPYKAQGRKSKIMMLVGGIVLSLLAGFALGAGGMFGQGIGKDPNQVAMNGGDGSGSLAQGLSKGRSPSTLLGGSLGQPLTQQLGQAKTPSTQNLGNDYQPPVLNQGGFQPPPVLNQRPNTNPPVTGQYDKMPADVRAWLEHLEYVESERKRLSSKQLSMFMSQMTGMAMSGDAFDDLTAEAFGRESKPNSDPNQNYDPGKRSKVEQETKVARQSWRDINTYFNSKQPPAECVPIKNSYEQCLGETSAMMRDILDALESSHNNPQGAISSLMGMMGTSQGKIDIPADQTDRQVSDICRKYETYKWFSVSGDFGGGLGALGGLGGLGGGGLGGMDLSGLADLLGG